MTAAAPAKNYAPSQPGLVPKAVRLQAAEADRLIAELNAPPPNNAAPPPAPPASPAPPRAPAPPPDNQMVDAPPPSANAPNYEQMYKVLQGKYNAEVPAIRAQLEQTNGLVKDLLTRATQPAAPAAPPPAALTDEQKLLALGVTPKQIEDFGVELLMLMSRLGSSAVTPQIQQLAQETAQLKDQNAHIAGGLHQRSQEAVYTALNEKVTNWSEINQSDHFKEWLSKVDVFSGVSKHTSLIDAFKKCDSVRVVAIFQAYEQENAARGTAQPHVDPATLLSAAPRGQAPVAPEGSGKRIWSENEVRDFYNRVRKKKVSPEEYAETQKELALATAEGRIKPDNQGFLGNN